MTRMCITCKYYDDYFTRKCDNPNAVAYGKEQEPMSGCQDWEHHVRAWDDQEEHQGKDGKD